MPLPLAKANVTTRSLASIKKEKKKKNNKLANAGCDEMWKLEAALKTFNLSGVPGE